MKIATLLFTYNRRRHTEIVLRKLRQNINHPEKLFIFQDGLRESEDAEEWNKVNQFIKRVDWCDTEIIVSEYNKGLAASIVAGITYVFKEYDAIIVLEDDCIPAPSFINFMRQCFEKYQHDKRVYSVSGYAYPISLAKQTYDIYGCGRISSWGWGTWRDRWEYYKKDYELVRKMKQEKTASRNLAIWGTGLEDMLVGNIRGICDTWAAFWALNVIAKGGVCVNPYKSLIRNIGFDGSGVHCSVTDRYDVELDETEKVTFNLPNEICISDEVTEAFVPLLGSSYTALNQDDGIKEKILVYGLGDYYLKNEQQICQRYYVKAFIDRKKRGWFAGKKIIREKEKDQYTYDRILIMIHNDEECLKVQKELIAEQIDPERILIGCELCEREM